MSVQSDEDDEYLAMVEGQRGRALATIERVRVAVGALLQLQYKAFEDAEAGYRNAAGYADAYENAGRLITEALEGKAPQ